MLTLDPNVPLVVDNVVDDPEHYAHSDSDKRKASNTLRPSAIFLEDDWECTEEHVKLASVSITELIVGAARFSQVEIETVVPNSRDSGDTNFWDYSLYRR